jgi:NAD+ kinase
MSCIEMTLICPHSLFARPVVFTADSELSVRFSLRDYQQVFLTADGDPAIEVGGEETVKIKQSKYKIGIVNFENNSFFDSLSKKFMHPIK